MNLGELFHDPVSGWINLLNNTFRVSLTIQHPDFQFRKQRKQAKVRAIGKHKFRLGAKGKFEFFPLSQQKDTRTWRTPGVLAWMTPCYCQV